MRSQHRRWVLAGRPTALPEPAHFRLEDGPLPEPAEEQALIAVSHVSVDPGMRARLSGDSYAPALPLGAVIESAGVGHVIASRAPKLKEGDAVSGGFGWQSHVLTDGRGVSVIPDRPAFLPLTAYIGVLGIPGLTAFFGLTEIARLQAGDRLLVSSAAGPVGATAGQIGKLLGGTVAGIAGGPVKCAYLHEIGFDAAIDHRAGDLEAALRAACAEGVDVYFDNVGGTVLDAALSVMRPRGRIAVSGQVSEYNRSTPVGIRNTTRFIPQRLSMTGFVVYDFAKQFGAARAQMTSWIESGRLTYREELVAGLENAPAAFLGLFSGDAFGRRLISV